MVKHGNEDKIKKALQRAERKKANRWKEKKALQKKYGSLSRATDTGIVCTLPNRPITGTCYIIDARDKLKPVSTVTNPPRSRLTRLPQKSKIDTKAAVGEKLLQFCGRCRKYLPQVRFSNKTGGHSKSCRPCRDLKNFILRNARQRAAKKPVVSSLQEMTMRLLTEDYGPEEEEIFSAIEYTAELARQPVNCC
jgi:hypothetical protein